MQIDNMLAYAEVDEILNLLEDKYREKVPQDVREFFKKQRMKDYKPNIDATKSLTEQNLKRETLTLLTILNLNYWCEDESEKQEFLEQLVKNEKEKRQIEEQCNPDKLFKEENTKKDIPQFENIALVEYQKKGVFKKFFKKVFSLFRKKK